MTAEQKAAIEYRLGIAQLMGPLPDEESGALTQFYAHDVALLLAALAPAPAAPDAGLLGELARLDALGSADAVGLSEMDQMRSRLDLDTLLYVSEVLKKLPSAASASDAQSQVYMMFHQRRHLARHGAPAAAWVAATERLPTNTFFQSSHMVLALLWNGNQVVAYYDYVASFWREHTEGQKLDITHWQPLPTPPTQP